MEGHSSHGDDGNAPDPAQQPSPAGRVRHDPFLIGCRIFSVITSLAAILCIVVNVLSAVKSFKNGSDIFDGIFRCYAVVIAIFVVIAETEWEFIMKFSKVALWMPILLHFYKKFETMFMMVLRTVQRNYYFKNLKMMHDIDFLNIDVTDITEAYNNLMWWVEKFKAAPPWKNLFRLFFGSGILGGQGDAANLVRLNLYNVAVMTRAYPEYLKDRPELFLLQSIASYLLLSCGAVYLVSGILCIGMVKRARQSKELSREQAIKNLEDLERRREELESLLLDRQV